LALQAYEGIALVGVKTAETGAAPQRDTFQAGDTLMLRGDATSAAQLAQDLHLSPNAEGGESGAARQWIGMESGLAEVVIPPRSALIGKTVFPGMVTASGDLMVLAVQRGGIDLPARPEPLRAGDHLLLKGSWQALDQELATPQVLVVDAPDLIRRQSQGLGQTAPRAFAVMGLLVLLLATGWVPPAVAGVTCAILMVVLGVVTVPEAYRGMDWNTVVLLAGMIPLSTAIQQTGAADQMAHQLLVLVGDAGPRALVAGLFVLTVILGQLISNTATALIVAPIAVAAAFELGISPRPVLMSIAVAAAASFLTPIATPPNLMIQGPGGYQFGDYWKLGLPLTLWFFVVAVFWVPVMWPFGTR
ncbi:MAG TPA: SLC13 family permease, partial [Rubrivivax sp.]|nr:SLC13 family permease [Rubrivivax sp.]